MNINKMSFGSQKQPQSKKEKPIVNLRDPDSDRRFPPLDKETLEKFEKYFEQKRKQIN